MITKSQMSEILKLACSTGADFAEIYFEDKTSTNVRVVQDKVDDAVSQNEYGCALRLLNGVEEAYGYTNDTSFEGLVALANKLKANFNSNPVVMDVELKDKNVDCHTKFKSLDVDMNKLCDTLKSMTWVPYIKMFTIIDCNTGNQTKRICTVRVCLY